MVRNLAAARLAIGLAQGVALYLLWRTVFARAWPATDTFVFAPAALVVALAPFLALLGLGTMRLRTLLIWLGVASAVLIVLALHDVNRMVGVPVPPGYSFGLRDGAWPTPSGMLAIFTIAMLFIAHALVAAGDADRRKIAAYPTYFDVSWKLAVQLLLAAGFVAAFWAVLWLGAALFSVIGLTFFRTLIMQTWFGIIATATAAAFAIHVTDVRPGLVRGIRTLKLTLLSWLLPLLALIAAGFLVALVFTGVTPLWDTKRASAILIVAGALLVLFINAAYQDGSREIAMSRAVRYAGLAGAIVLVPIVALAAYALGLRVAQHGWTMTRIAGAATLVVLVCYAIGYAAGALRHDAFLPTLERCNVWTSFVILAVLLALFTPIADPARIAVNDQMARLAAGATPITQFDYKFLRWDAARYGIAALKRLEESQDKAIAALATDTAKAPNRYTNPIVAPQPPDIAGIPVFPAGKTLPPSFLQQDWSSPVAQGWQAPCLMNRNLKCEVVLIDLDGDGMDEIVILGATSLTVPVYRLGPNGLWRSIGQLPIRSECKDTIAAFKAGTTKRLPAAWNDLEIGGVRFRLNTSVNDSVPSRCP